ncbi:MAG: hypothetical protein CMM56_04635 [Rhodospirillaceae bacterium]|nr:hypothetical protein [Rhodospirillaceae bacterium]
MKLFIRLYDLTLRWARHPRAEGYLVVLSFSESSFFPIPPDVMLMPMALANPKRSWRYAILTTVASVIGGLLGYFIGLFALDMIEPVLVRMNYWEGYLRARVWFLEWGFLAVFLAGFSPIPYKIFTIAAGALNMFLPVFILASFIGRGGRFFLVAALIYWGGVSMEKKLRKHVEWIGWGSLILIGIIFYAIRFRGESI